MTEQPRDSNVDDPRGEARLVDRVAAVELVLASRGLEVGPTRLLEMIAWILEDLSELPRDVAAARVFIASIKAPRR